MNTTKHVAALSFVGVVGFALACASVATAEVMLVSDTGPDRVLRYELDNTGVHYSGIFSQGVLAGSGLDHPMGMTLGRDGWVYVGEQKDAGRILRFSPDGTFLDVVAASGTGGFAGGRPESVEAGPNGNIYVTTAFGSNSNRVFKIDVGQASPQVTEFIAQTGWGGSLSAPRGLSFGPDGNAYISDRNNNRILKFDGSTGAFIERFDTSGAPSSPQDLYWHEDSLYVSSGSTVRRYNTAGQFIESYASGSGTNIGLGALGDAVYSVNWGDSKVFQRIAPDPATAVVPTGEAGEPSIGGNSFGHVLFYMPPEVAVLDTVGDVHVNLSNSTNYGSINRMRVGIQGGGDDSGIHEAFVGFDLSSIPADVTVGNVMFRAIQTDGYVGSGFRVSEVTSAWDEGTISGTNLPSVAGTAVGNMAVRLNTAPWNGVSTFQHANLTQLAQDWIGGYKGNHGLNFKMINTSDGDTFASREHTTYDAPQMVVTYELPGVYTKAVRETGPMAYYRMSETGGPNARDAVGGKHGAFSNVTLAQAGPNPASQPIGFRGMESINRGAQFNGTSGWVDLGFQIRDGLASAAAKAISIEAWINPDELGGTQNIAATRIHSGAAGAELRLLGGNLNMAGRSSTSDSYQNFSIDFLDAGGSADEWHHVVGILDFSGDEIRIYVDGLLADAGSAIFNSGTYTVGPTKTQSDRIGQSPAGGGFFQGLLDEVAFYPYALDAHPTLGNRVWEHYHSGLIPEPHTAVLALLALLSLAGLRPRRRR